MNILFSSMMVTVLSIGMTQLHAQTPTQLSMPNQSIENAQAQLVNLFFAAAKMGNNEVIQEFLKYGFPVDIRNATGYTPLMMATYYGHQNIVTTLLKNGANPCARDHKGNTALMGAIFKLEWSIAKQLRKVDCDLNAKQTGQKTAAEFAKVVGQEKQLKALIEKNL